MFLVFLIFLTSSACLIVSLLALGIVLKYTYFSQESEILTNDDDAIIITGCDSGIGLELAKYFYQTCRFKIICCFLDATQSQGYKELSKLSDQNRLITKQLDVISDEDVDDVATSLTSLKEDAKIRRLIGLINNAGVMAYGEFDWLTWDQIQKQINVNLVGTLRLTRAILPFIIESKGRIINVTSVNDATVFPGLSVYSATKSALSTFSRGLGYEMRKFGVKVTTIRLGDFARLTNIMAGHADHRDDMWNAMSSKKKTIYKEFFHEFNDHLLRNYGMTSPRKFSDSTLFLDFRSALLARNPPTTITCAPLTFKLFYFMIELIPVWIQYYLLDFLIESVFRWQAPKVATTRASGDIVDPDRVFSRESLNKQT